MRIHAELTNPSSPVKFMLIMVASCRSYVRLREAGGSGVCVAGHELSYWYVPCIYSVIILLKDPDLEAGICLKKSYLVCQDRAPNISPMLRNTNNQFYRDILKSAPRQLDTDCECSHMNAATSAIGSFDILHGPGRTPMSITRPSPVS